MARECTEKRDKARKVLRREETREEEVMNQENSDGEENLKKEREEAMRIAKENLPKRENKYISPAMAKLYNIVTSDPLEDLASRPQCKTRRLDLRRSRMRKWKEVSGLRMGT